MDDIQELKDLIIEHTSNHEPVISSFDLAQALKIILNCIENREPKN